MQKSNIYTAREELKAIASAMRRLKKEREREREWECERDSQQEKESDIQSDKGKQINTHTQIEVMLDVALAPKTRFGT